MKIKLLDYLENSKDTYTMNKDKFKANPNLEQFYIEQIKALNDAIDLVQEEGLDLLKLTV